MKKMLVAAVAASFVSGMAVHAQQGPVVEAQPVDAAAQALPVNTLVLVTPAEEITSKMSSTVARSSFRADPKCRQR
jgi:hypothetical protein